MKQRCQVCDGPVVNGRCKLCGMPYRNDEILYHLNENRRDHYRHATSAAREIMREKQVPLGDKKTAGSAGKTRASAASKASGQYKKQTGAVSSGTQKSAGRTTYRAPGQTPAKSSSYSGRSEKKKNSKVGVIMTVIVCAAAILPTMITNIKDTYIYEMRKEGRESEALEGYAGVILTKSDGEMEAGTDMLPEGWYTASLEDGYATIKVEDSDGIYRFYLSEDMKETDIFLLSGTLISIHNTDEESREVYFDLEEAFE